MKTFWDRRSKESKGDGKRRSMGREAVVCAAAVGRLIVAVVAERRPSREGAWAWEETAPLAGSTCAVT